MHRGTVGFLMNEYSDKHLVDRLAAAEVTVIHPLLMRARGPAHADFSCARWVLELWRLAMNA